MGRRQRKLALSVPVTFDTVYGASWSPDGTKIAFGCADNTVRAIDAKTGEQVLFMGSHNDWVLDTVFSADGSHLISVGRDMAAKLTEVATQRFIDNITSITPGALKGGLTAVARHPKRDEIVMGGSDGEPKLYRVFRKTIRVIGDDSNLIREFPALPGRVYSVAISNDGKRIAAGSSLDGTGEVSVYTYEFDTDLPANIKAIQEKVVTARSAEEAADARQISQGGGQADRQRQDSRGWDLRRGVPPRRQGPGRGGRRWARAAVQSRERLAGQGVRPGAGQDRLGGAERPGDGRPAEARGSGRDRDAAAGYEPRVAGGSAAGDPADQPVRVRPAPGHRQAGVGRDDRRDPDGRALASRPRSPRFRGRGYSGPRRTARGPWSLRLAGKTASVPVTVLGLEHAGARRLRARRGAGAVAAGLQRGHLPRLGPGQERLQALAPRL